MSAIIGTWRMVYTGLIESALRLREGADAAGAVVSTIEAVENQPEYDSVGYGGLPDHEGRVRLDAAFMNGDTLRFGAVMSVENVQNPIRLAHALCGRKRDNVLVGAGAEQTARALGLPVRDMRTEEGLRKWREAIAQPQRAMDPYRHHDTVCVLALDDTGCMAAGTSTSGLFMKAAGRVGDSPIVGSGFYCDSRYGAAAATGVGEEIMRGCLSYEIVARMRDGVHPKEACEGALKALADRIRSLGDDAGNLSVIALRRDGAYGAATTLDGFPFAIAIDGEAQLFATKAGDSPSYWSIAPTDPVGLA